MILGIDIGNTHIAFGCIDNNSVIKPILRIPTDRKDTEFLYAIRIKEILNLSNIDIKKIEGTIISSVVPPVTDTIKRAVEIILDKKIVVVGPGIKSGIKIGIDDPGALAADLLSTAVGALYNYKSPCIIIDMGTATTVTLIDENNVYRGGVIYPGINTSISALKNKTALLPGIEIKAPKKVIGTNTIECMQSGIIYGTAGAIDGIIDAFISSYGKIETIVCTGGIGHTIYPYFKHKVVMDEDLLLKGLGIIWNKNNNKL